MTATPTRRRTTTGPGPGRLTEAEWQRQVTDLAAILGWQWVHFRPARTAHGWRTPVEGPMGKGWPDLVLTRPGRVLFAELKAAGGRPSPDQEWVLDRLRLAGAETYCWSPADWDAIVEILR